MLNRFVLILSFALFTANVVYAGPLEDCYSAAFRGDDEEAVRIWMPLAGQGLAEAQFLIGAAYAQGRGLADIHPMNRGADVMMPALASSGNT